METCDELILWFGDGEYVEKALDLKRLYQPLTPAQEDKYKQFREKKGMVEISLPQSTERKNVIKEMVKTAECTSEEASETTVTASKFNTSKLQEELAKSMRQIMNATEKETVADTMENIKKIVSDIPYLNGEHGEEAEHAFDQEKINAQVDRSLKKDFHALMKEQEESEKEEQETQKQDIAKEEVRENADDAQSEIKEIKHAGEKADAEEVASAQASIEEVLEEWKKDKACGGSCHGSSRSEEAGNVQRKCIVGSRSDHGASEDTDPDSVCDTGRRSSGSGRYRSCKTCFW